MSAIIMMMWQVCLTRAITISRIIHSHLESGRKDLFQDTKDSLTCQAVTYFSTKSLMTTDRSHKFWFIAKNDELLIKIAIIFRSWIGF